MIYRSPFADVRIPLQSLPVFVLEHAHRHPQKAALIDGLTGRTVSYGALAQAARKVAAGLVSAGLQKGDVVAICSPNTPEYPMAVYGALLAGATVTTVNPLYNVTELRHQLRDSQTSTIFASPETLDTVRQAVSTLDGIRLYVFLESAPTGVGDFESLLETSAAYREADVVPREDVAALLYTSATTGLPKGVMLTHYNLVANTLQVDAIEQMRASEIAIGVVPFYHVYGIFLMNTTLRTGATLVTLPRFVLQDFLEAVQAYRVTTGFLVPPIARALSTHPLVDRYDLSSFKRALSSAAPLPENVAEAFTRRTGCVIKQSYGLTETSPATHGTPWDHVKITSVGVVLPNTECCIVNVASKQELEAGRLGEVWVRGPQVMKGYINNAEYTRRMVDTHGWLHTGDIGYADQDGYLHIVDRAKDLVKFRGLQFRDDELLQTMVEDGAARLEADRRLRFQARLIDSVSDSIVVTDREHRVTLWNHGAEALFGYSAGEAMGEDISRLIMPDDPDAQKQWQDELSTIAARGEWKGVAQRRRKDGRILWTDLSVSEVRDEDGRVSGLIAVHRDVTQMRHNQQILQDSHEQLQNLVSRLMTLRTGDHGLIDRELNDEMTQALGRLNTDLYWLNELVTGTQHATQERLTEREREVLARLGAAERISHIARDLRLSVNTVRTYRARLLEKLGLDSTADLIRYAVQNELAARPPTDKPHRRAPRSRAAATRKRK